MTLISAPHKAGRRGKSGVLFNQLMSQPDVSEFRLAPLRVARIVGTYLVGLALLMFAATALVTIADWPGDLLAGLLGLGLIGMFGLGWWLRNRAYVVRFEVDGYRIGLVRGAGARQACWAEVTDAGATSPGGAPCVELRLRDGGSTVVPMDALAVDREVFVRELRARLQQGHGLRPL